ncbi:hypothetical protein V495_03794 [Pseudogymnoascus sp. VKM F-4514 (FW-929)]|nr:hypothetical protein V495_03794 [Pseudogymnoascus sp. VKM F-4514 (FW-929)]
MESEARKGRECVDIKRGDDRIDEFEKLRTTEKSPSRPDRALATRLQQGSDSHGDEAEQAGVGGRHDGTCAHGAGRLSSRSGGGWDDAAGAGAERGG